MDCDYTTVKASMRMGLYLFAAVLFVAFCVAAFVVVV